MLSNIWFDRLRDLPDEGTHQETLAVLIQGHRLRERLAGTRLTMNHALEGADRIWAEYEHALAPYVGTERRSREEALSRAAKELSQAFVALGPMTILQDEAQR